MTLELDLSFTWFTFEEQLHSIALISTCRVTAKTHTHMNVCQEDKSYRTQRHARKQTLIGGMWGFGKCRLDGHFVQRLLEFEYWFNSTPTFHFCGRRYGAVEAGRIWDDLCCHLLDANGTTWWRALTAGGKRENWHEIKRCFCWFTSQEIRGKMLTFSEEKSKWCKTCWHNAKLLVCGVEQQ